MHVPHRVFNMSVVKSRTAMEKSESVRVKFNVLFQTAEIRVNVIQIS